MSTRILIIEDNEPNLELMRYLLSAHGYLALCAQTGTEGLAVARAERPDLIICDIQMPEMDGYEVAKQLQADPVLASVPRLGVTALAMLGDREKVLSEGFHGYIPKPIEPERFLSQMERYLPGLKRASGPENQSGQPLAVALPPRGSLLVVDDRSINLALSQSIFEPSGYSVLTATAARPAFELALAHRPDLIISDVQLVRPYGGFELIQMVKADAGLRDTPFLFVTSTYCDEASRVRGLELGATRFLFRPVEPELLLREVETCLNGRRR